MKIGSIGEFGLIEKIKGWCPVRGEVVCGIGDDAAVLRTNDPRLYQLIAIDTIVEGVDFKMNQATPGEIGRKALAVNLSDIAAMGGRPVAAVVSLTLPRRTNISFVQRFYAGMGKLARRFGVSMVGGDLSRGRQMSASIAVLGEVERRHCVFRTRAKAGDRIGVTGVLGGSILGKHLTFEPRIEEGQFLARHGASAMIDISDGLAQDLGHLFEKNRLGFVLDEQKIPVSCAAVRLARGNRKRALGHACSDGEDFELLFTMSAARLRKLQAGWPKRFSVPLTVIGKVVKGPRKGAGHFRPGFRHF